VDGGLAGVSQIVKDIKAFNPDFIGITCWSINRETVWDLCAAVHSVVPKAFLALGGQHASFYPEHVLRKTHASAVVIGEGEETFKELLHALESGSDLKGIKGLAIRDSDGTCFYTGKRDRIDDLDSIPLPYYEGFKNFKFTNYAGYPALPRPTAAIISSRGCVYNCTFCGSTMFWGSRWRYRSAANILNEIEWLRKTYRVQSIFFFDDNFTVNQERVANICDELIRRGWNIPWSCCSHVKMVNRKLLALMKRSGCVNIDFGVESGSDRILANIRKQQKRSDIERTFALVHEMGIKPRACLMVGNPGEDESTIDQTVDMINTIKPWSSIGSSILWLLPGTTVYADAVASGYISDDYWLTHDDVPYNLQEYSYRQLYQLRQRLMHGIASGKGSIKALINYHIKSLYYRFPKLNIFRHLIPNFFK
jgi:radical SAM superfamily enzyme YgiQ (UPF0313 family)